MTSNVNVQKRCSGCGAPATNPHDFKCQYCGSVWEQPEMRGFMSSNSTLLPPQNYSSMPPYSHGTRYL